MHNFKGVRMMTNWKPMDSAPRDGSIFLARIRWEDEPVVVWWPKNREQPSIFSTGLDVAAGWDGGIIVQRGDNEFVEWCPIPE
jgi:hypothetical protein